jgi:hypothetical protein
MNNQYTMTQYSYRSSNEPAPKYMVESGWGIPCQTDFSSTFFLDPLENQQKWAECSSTRNTPASANSPTTQSRNSPSNESAQNSSGQHSKFLPSLQQDTSKPDGESPASGHGPSCQFKSLSPVERLRERSTAKCSSHPRPLTDEEKFNTLYAETLEKFNSQSAVAIEIVDPLIRKGKIGVQILAKAYNEKNLVSAKQIPEAMAAFILEASKPVEDFENFIAVLNPMEALSDTDPKFIAEIFVHMKIDENLERVLRLLAYISASCDVKFLSILPYATQARFLVQMNPIKASGILCAICEDDQMQFIGNNSKAVGAGNAVKILSEMDNSIVEIILRRMISSMKTRYAAIILAEMPFQSRAKEAANILAATDIQVVGALLSQMRICGRETGAVAIIKLMDIEKVALIFAEMVLSRNVKNAIITLKMLDPEVIVNIVQKILALNRREAAMKIFVKMDSQMMENVLFVIEKAQEAQSNPAEILKIFPLLPLENAISVFNAMGNQLAAKILATVMEQDMATKILAALYANSTAEIIKLMYANKRYQFRVLEILPSLTQCDMWARILSIMTIKFLVDIVVLMCKKEMYISAAIIALKNESILRKKRLNNYEVTIRGKMNKIIEWKR